MDHREIHKEIHVKAFCIIVPSIIFILDRERNKKYKITIKSGTY